MAGYTEWTARDSAGFIAVPRHGDDKYSRGVVGVVTGSTEYPGAAVLGVEAALRTGVGMVRYLGPERPSGLVLQRRPEAVTVPGRVQAWLLGSGMDAGSRDAASTRLLQDALAQGLPTVLDAGALDLLGQASGPVVITPHYRELAGVLGVGADEIAVDPAHWCGQAATRLGVTVLLKGSQTHVAGADGSRLVTPVASSWLATAGSGDALGGVLGAILATHSDALGEDPALIVRLAATAAVIHALAGQRASAGGPLTVLDLAAAIPHTIAALLREYPPG